jgi:Ca-activated chloride channel family protein
MLRDYLHYITFDWPWMLALVLLLPWVYMRLQKGKNEKTATLLVPALRRIPTAGNWRVRLMPSLVWLRMLALLCLVVALAKPAHYRTIELTQGEGIDIVLCLDVSGSMLARDFVPDRLRASIQVARDFVARRKGDRIGLVIFSGQSISLAPLTTDHSVLLQQLGNIDYGKLADGTAIGSGLASAVDRLKAGDAKSKVVILLTDGEDTGGFIDPATAKEIAKALGIKVYAIGVGTKGLAPMPYQTPMGIQMREEKVNIDEALLTAIATETGGRYFRATNVQSLDSVYTTINELETSKVETTVFRKRTDEYFAWALAAILLLCAEWLLRYAVFKKFP